MSRVYEVYPEKKKGKRGTQKHWVEEGSIGIDMIKQLGFEGSLKPTDGIEFEFEEQRRGIGIEKPKKVEMVNPLDSILKKVKSVSPNIQMELQQEMEEESKNENISELLSGSTDKKEKTDNLKYNLGVIT